MHWYRQSPKRGIFKFVNIRIRKLDFALQYLVFQYEKIKNFDRMDDHYNRIIAFLLHFLPYKDTLKFQKQRRVNRKYSKGVEKLGFQRKMEIQNQ